MKKKYIPPMTHEVKICQLSMLLAGSYDGPNPDDQQDPDMDY